MQISVIIPTYNGSHKLPEIIRSLKKQRHLPDEILVVVDGSTDDTLLVLDTLKAEVPILKVIVQENKGRAAVRNRGVRESTGELLIFFDDDMLPEEQCIAAHVQHHSKMSNSILTGAQLDLEGNSRTDIQNYKAALSRKWTRHLYEMGNSEIPEKHLFLTGANFSISRSTFNQLGGFDERLRDAEDYDLAIRAHQAGVRLFFGKEALAWHNDQISGRSYVRRIRQYNIAHQKLLELSPELYKGRLTSNPMPEGRKKAIFQFFANRFWVNWLDRSGNKLIPKKVRYKLYDIITTANGVYFPENVPL